MEQHTPLQTVINELVAYMEAYLQVELRIWLPAVSERMTLFRYVCIRVHIDMYVYVYLTDTDTEAGDMARIVR